MYRVQSIFKKKNKNELIKSFISIKQTKNHLNLAGAINGNNIEVVGLWLISRDKQNHIKVSEDTFPATNFNFSIGLEYLIQLLKNKSDDVLFDWYFKIRQPYSQLTKVERASNNLETFKINGEIYAEQFLRCGRFQHSQVDDLDFYYKNEDKLINYLTVKGNLSIAINQYVDSPTRIQVERFKAKESRLQVEGKLFTRNAKILNGEIFLKGRKTNQLLNSTNIQFQHLTAETKSTFGLNRYYFKAWIELKDGDYFLEEDIYDLFLKLDLHDHLETKYVRIGRPTFRARFFLKDFYLKGAKEAIIVNPYFTFKYNNLSLEVYKYPMDTFLYLRKLLRWSWLIKLLNLNKNVWIVGERIYKAQDTGYAFFKYMRTKHPDKEVYYVIDKESPEKRNVEPLGNVLDFKSRAHIFNTLIAKKVISSHHPDYLYPLRTNIFKKKVKATKVFLQHGVMGTKNMVANYGKNAEGFETDLFMVSSDFEKKMIVEDFGYSPQDVFVTGLSRFDTLFTTDIQKKRQVLIIPTWRDWITSDDAFFESEYFERYNLLIHNKRLHQLSQTHGFEIIFCLHPNMQRFSHYFQNDYIQIIHQGEVDVQQLIKESSLMITDYSSVGFDFSFLYKPVLYYQFDRERFIGNRPSHLDLNEDLPGEICFQLDELIQLVESYANHNFIMKKKYEDRADRFIKFRDLSSSERIYNVINKAKVSKRFLETPRINMILDELFRRYRESKYYFPSMRLFYRIGSKLIPVDKRLIVFESGLGKQFGDSPKNIYEEIVRQELDYKKVWIYNQPVRFADPHTTRVERLSPKYFYYLLRAKYWVNNQNFPTYLTKRPETTYLQTWHGTPLKKMLYDINEVQGRSDDYVERVGAATKNWDYLISPSPYATNAFKSAFRYDGKILEIGYPRNDIFYNDQQHKLAKKIRSKLHLNQNKKVILYAPTFRDDQTISKNRFFFEINMDLNAMKDKLGEDYVVLLRMHVIVNNRIQIEDSLQDFVYNVSGYPDIQELLLATDILITDYSSVMFDFANTGKPMLFYTYDLENYRDRLRGFYMDLEQEAPGPLVYNTNEIINSIKNIDRIKDIYRKKYYDFQQKYCLLDDGLVSKKVVDLVFKTD